LTQQTGWRYKFIWQNPPPQLLEAEISKNTDFALTLARCLPRVRVLSSSVTPLGGGYSKVLIALRNDGWLPTNGTTQALVTASVRRGENLLYFVLQFPLIRWAL